MATRKAGLGRGLESLIPSGAGEPEYRRLKLDDIHPNPQQPRVTFDDQGLDDLAGGHRVEGHRLGVVIDLIGPLAHLRDGGPAHPGHIGQPSLDGLPLHPHGRRQLVAQLGGGQVAGRLDVGEEGPAVEGHDVA